MSWVLLVALGAAMLWAMGRSHPKVDVVLVRLAGGAFMGAGLIGANGWLGAGIEKSVQWMISATDAFGAQALGQSVAWILAAGVGLLWVAAMLPDKLFTYDPPNWLVWSGIVVPAFLKTVPGDLGEGLRDLTTLAGEAVTEFFGRLL